MKNLGEYITWITAKSSYIGNAQQDQHYSDIIMDTMASEITSLAIVYSSVYSDADQRKHQSSASLAFVREFTGEFSAQRASDAEIVYIWWRHYEAHILWGILHIFCILYDRKGLV